MITIQKIQQNNVSRPERELTTEEKATVICGVSNADSYIYYQIGDEVPQTETTPNPDAIAMQKLESDIEFGKNLINEFLLDNRLAPQSFTPQESLALLQKLQAIQALSSFGDIKSVAILMPLVEIDSIFTQERKDKYVAMITNYLAQWV